MNEQSNGLAIACWKRTVNGLMGGIWLYTLAGIGIGVLSVVKMVINPGGIMSAVMSLLAMLTDGEMMGGLGIFEILEYLMSFLLILGYVIFFRALFDFEKLQLNEEDSENVRKIKISYVLLVLAILAGYIPFVIIGFILKLALLISSYVKILSGFKGLRDSKVLPEEARRGARLIKNANIWMLIGGIFSVVPLLGAPVNALIEFITFFVILAGWRRIKRGCPVLSDEDARRINEDFKPLNVKAFCWFLIALFGIYVLSNVTSYVLGILHESSDGLTEILRYVFLFAEICMLIWLLAYRKMHLSSLERIGAWLMLLYLFARRLFYMFVVPMGVMSTNSLVIIDIALTCTNYLGFMMLIIPANINKALKIVACLDTPMFMLNSYWIIASIIGKYLIHNATHEDYVLIRKIGPVVLSIIFFILVFIFAYHEIKKNNRLYQPQQ